jgi:hypothetical protein
MQLAIIREWSGTIVRMPLPSTLRAKVNDGVLCPHFVKSCQDWIAEHWGNKWSILEIIPQERAIPLDRV